MRRAVSVLATACVLGLTATACSDSSGGATAAAPEGSVNPTASLKGVKLTMWVAQNSVSEPKQAIEAFEKATGAKITTEVIPDPYESNVPTKLASGVKPDLMFWQPTASTLPFVQPAKNLLQLDNEDWVSKLGTTEKTLGQVDGHRYAAIVTSPAVLGVYYNKAVFKKAGITTMPSSYDEMLADAAKIKAKTDAAPFFEVGGDKWPLQWQVQAQLTDLPQSFWDNLNKNKDTWTNKTIVDAITKYKTKILDGGLAQKNYKTATFVDQGKAVMDGSAGMALNVTALQSEIQATSSTAEMDKKLGWFPIANSSAKAEYSPTRPTASSPSTPATPSVRTPPGSSCPSGSARTTRPTSRPTSSCPWSPPCPTPTACRRRPSPRPRPCPAPRASSRSRRSPPPTCTSPSPT